MFTVVLDACVILPATLSDTLLRLAEADSFGVRWSATILEEVRRNMVGSKFNVSPEKADKRIDAMQEAFPFAEVQDYEELIPAMGNDPKDRHVLAATVRSEAHTIVTMNLKDFPESSTRAWGVEVVHPDAFLCNQLDLEPNKVRAVLQEQVDNNFMPPTTIKELCDSLAKCGVPNFAARLAQELSD